MEKKESLEKNFSLDAEELLAAEMEEIEGGAEAICSSCAFLCYANFW